MSVIAWVAAAVVVVIGFMTMRGEKDSEDVGGNFSATQYLKRGSAAVGNTYRINANVMEVNSHGGSRIIEVMTPEHKRIGLFVPADARLNANVRKGMDYVFTVKGRNGKMEDGTPVKGILVVTQAEAK